MADLWQILAKPTNATNGKPLAKSDSSDGGVDDSINYQSIEKDLSSLWDKLKDHYQGLCLKPYPLPLGGYGGASQRPESGP